MTATKVTQELLDRIYAQAAAGVGWQEIASGAHLEYGKVQRWLIEAGFTPRQGRPAATVSDELAKRIVALAEQGVGQMETARQLGLSRDTVRKYRRLAGYQPLGHGQAGYRSLDVPRCRRCEILLTDELQGRDGLCKYCMEEQNAQ